ncbi:MAG: hypothetical protein WA199_19865 [Xanthobacteraceae bacterium]
MKAPPPAPTPATTWTGFYVGINAGAAWWTSGMNEQTTGTGIVNGPIAFGSEGHMQAAGGFQAGYNWQFNPQWVAGIEGDFSFPSIVNNGPRTAIPGAGPGNFVSMNETVNWLGTARGKFGYDLGSTLWYATGGVAWDVNRRWIGTPDRHPKGIGRRSPRKRGPYSTPKHSQPFG